MLRILFQTLPYGDMTSTHLELKNGNGYLAFCAGR